MSAYANDPRVKPIEFGDFSIDEGAADSWRRGHVFRQDSGTWAARSAYSEPGEGTVGDFATADEAIRSLIGDPQ